MELYLWTNLAVEPDLVGKKENVTYFSTTKLGSGNLRHFNEKQDVEELIEEHQGK